MKLSEVINKLKEGQMAKATFADDTWFIIKDSGFIRYLFNNEIADIVTLSYSNLNAYYEIIPN